MALLHSTWFYINLPWLYFTLLDSTLLYYCSASLYLTQHFSTMPLPHSTWPSFLYRSSRPFYLTLHYATIVVLHSAWLYILVQLFLTWIYICLAWLYFTVLDSTLLHIGSASLFQYFTMDLLHSTWFYITLLRLSFIKFYLTLCYSKVALCGGPFREAIDNFAYPGPAQLSVPENLAGPGYVDARPALWRHTKHKAQVRIVNAFIL